MYSIGWKTRIWNTKGFMLRSKSHPSEGGRGLFLVYSRVSLYFSALTTGEMISTLFSCFRHDDRPERKTFRKSNQLMLARFNSKHKSSFSLLTSWKLFSRNYDLSAKNSRLSLFCLFAFFHPTLFIKCRPIWRKLESSNRRGAFLLQRFYFVPSSLS